MAKVSGPLLSMDASGMVGGLVVFTRTPTGHRAYKLNAPKNTGVQARKDYYADGCAAWRLLTPEEKQTWSDDAVIYQITGFNLFMKEWMLTYSPISGTVWDDGATTWDGGGTLWDVP